MTVSDRTLSIGACITLTTLLLAAILSRSVSAVEGPSKTSVEQPYIVEWVYKVKWGHSDEYLTLLQKYQFRILDREQQLGNVLRYAVYRPGLHTSEDERWDYRVVIVYRNALAPARSREIERQLFPDRDAFKKEESHRWELTEAHWDLPIREIDPHAPPD